MDFKYIDILGQKEWEDLTKKNSASGFMQSFFWADFNNLLNWTTYKIGIFEKDKLIGGAVIMKSPASNGKNYLYIPEGPVVSYEKEEVNIFHNLIGEIDNIADLEGEIITTHLRIEPKLTTIPSFFDRFQKAPYNIQSKTTLLIDLSLSEEEILKQMKPKGRYNIKVANKHGVKVEICNLQSGLDDFLKIYRSTLDRKRFEGKNEDYFNILQPLLIKNNNAKFFFAKYNNKILASALILYYGDKATFLFGASSDLHREMMAPYLLHWEIMSEAKNLGIRWYDLYGIAPDENDLNHPWHGFTIFKNKFGGEQVDYIGDFDFVYNKKLYQEYLKENEEII